MLTNDAFFTKETAEVTIQATVRRAVCAARLARRKGGMGAKTFVRNEFVGELLFIVNPLFKIVLHT